MKKQISKFALLLSIFGLSIIANAQIPPYVPSNGLVGWWPFSGNANDLSVNSNNGTNNGAVLTTDRFGVANSAYSFSSAYINVPNSSSLQFNNDISVSVWVNAYTLSSVNYILSKGSDGVTPYSWTFSFNSTGMGGFGIWNSGNGSPLGIPCGTGVVTPLIVNQWINLTATHNGTSANIYVNGVLDNTSPCSYTIFSNIYDLKFGRMGHPTGNWPYYLDGKLDDIGIWNRVLTQQEITNLYNSFLCTAPQPHVNDVSLCGGGVTTLTATGGTNYIWYSVPTGGTQISSGGTYTTPFLTSTTTYYVSNFDGTCESTRDTVVVTFVPLPTVTITSLSTGYCQNSSPITLTGSPAGGTFSGTGVAGSTFTPALVTSGSTTITYSYTDPVTTCNKTINQSVSVYSIPTVSFTGLNSNFNQNDPASTLIGTPTGGTFSGSGIIGNTFNPSIAGIGTHNIVYIYSDTHSCVNATCETTDITTYMKTISNAGNIEISIYPNPSSGTFSLAFVLDNSENVNIQVVNNLGEVVYKESKNNLIGNYNNMLDLSKLANGIYTLTVKIGNSASSEKISIMK